MDKSKKESAKNVPDTSKTTAEAPVTDFTPGARGHLKKSRKRGAKIKAAGARKKYSDFKANREGITSNGERTVREAICRKVVEMADAGDAQAKRLITDGVLYRYFMATRPG